MVGLQNMETSGQFVFIFRSPISDARLKQEPMQFSLS